ncbi:MAG: D-2-hydroxyacid dehydrogenase [Sulfurovum sp.]|nr:D-2-hydroxyacid dehydrogenase [Sulfurovum sp.]
MKLVLLDRKTLGDDLDLRSLKKFGDLDIFETTTANETANRVKDADIIISNKVIINRQIMEQAKNLRLICIAATGTNNVDLEAADELGISVKNVSGYSTQSVAQHTFALLLALGEQICFYDKVVKDGIWSKGDIFTDLSRPFFEIAGKEWGIIGMGNIGQEVAKIATAFGADISYYSTSGKNGGQGYKQKSLDELLVESDIVSIHAPLNERTDNLIHQDNLPLLKEKAILLNLGRGGIINEHDLAVEMNRREIYAGLDVTATEPIEALNPLLHINNPDRLLLTPHIAWSSKEARVKLLDGIVDNMQTFIKEKD